MRQKQQEDHGIAGDSGPCLGEGPVSLLGQARVSAPAMADNGGGEGGASQQASARLLNALNACLRNGELQWKGGLVGMKKLV